MISHFIVIFFSCAGAFSPPFPHKAFRGTSLYGIKGFRSWFDSVFPSALTIIHPDTPDFQPEVFDHVLIDANQFLHQTLRRAYNIRAKRSSAGQQQLDDDIIEHSLLLFIKELNRITTTTAIPRKSLVIAIDGSPGAAKLDRQRRRRYSIYKRAEAQERQIEVLRHRGWRDNDFGFSNNANKKNSNTPGQKHERERVTLNITPGTAFMDRVTDALLYWAWQHVSRYPRVKIYISPSSVHGEGEVKLLDWITFGQKPFPSPQNNRVNVRKNETLAFLGGDSDLVLMGLVVPPSITHNIHVILPGGKGESLVASIWETTRIMADMIEGTSTYGAKKTKKNIKRQRLLTLNQINQVRIDTTLLVILNGNDYLPKLKGCRAGFDSFFPNYLDLVQSSMDKQSDNNNNDDSFMINLDEHGELQMNVKFAIKFFRSLTSQVQTTSYDDNIGDSSASLQSQLGYLNNLVDSRIFPGPIEFNTIARQDSFFPKRVLTETFTDGMEVMRLTLGIFPANFVASTNTTALANEEIAITFLGGDDQGHGVIFRTIRTVGNGRAYLFEVPRRQNNSIKSTKERLARLALEEIFGIDNVDVLFEGNDYNNDDDECDLGIIDSVQQGQAKADAACYLGGLLWNLETYLNGCCVDYGYDYGSRASPMPFELVEYLETIDKQGNHRVTRSDLIGQTISAPISDGLSCLAAVPPQAWHIVPDPYSLLVQPDRQKSFDDMYNSCFHPDTRVFDIESFSRKCLAELATIQPERKVISGQSGSSNGRRIQVGNQFWTVLSRSSVPLTDPFEPPRPFSDRIPKLRKNSKIKATKIPVKTQIERLQSTTIINTSANEESEERDNVTRIQGSVHDIQYKTAFKQRSSRLGR